MEGHESQVDPEGHESQIDQEGHESQIDPSGQSGQPDRIGHSSGQVVSGQSGQPDQIGHSSGQPETGQNSESQAVSGQPETGHSRGQVDPSGQPGQPVLVGKYELHHSPIVSIITSPTSFISADSSGHIYLTQNSQSRLLYPHETPLIDVSWSADQRLVSWITSDAKAHVVDVEKNTYQQLAEKASFRSIAFDPTNNYLVLVDDDTVIHLYQYKYSGEHYQFRLTHKISRMINKNTMTVHYKRIGWSPEGELFPVATASKNHNTLISMVARSRGWHNKISLVGHGRTCEVIRFSPKIYNSVQGDNKELFSIVATTGADRTLCLWNTTKEAPILLLQDVSERAATDLAWDKSGSSLAFGTLDGYMHVVTFGANELGYEVSPSTFADLVAIANDSVKPLTYKYDSEVSGAGAIATAKKGNTIQLVDQKDAIRIVQPEPKGPEKVPLPEKAVDPPSTKKGQIIPQMAEGPDISRDATNDGLGAPKDVLASAPRTKKVVKPKKQPVKETIKNGKRRIQPTLISNGGGAPPPAPVSVLAPSKSLMEFDRPSYSVSDEFAKQNKRFRTDDPKKRRDLEPVRFIGSPIVNPATTFARVRLAVPKTRLGAEFVGRNGFVLDIKNGSGNETKPSRITYFKKDKQVWNDFVPRFVQLATEGSHFWALATADGQVLTYTRETGSRLLPPLVLGSPISFLESHERFLMVVTSIGELYVWDLDKRKVELTASVGPLLDLHAKFAEDGLSKGENITLCAVTSTGVPLVTLSNGSGYLYNRDFSTWQTVTESWWSFGSHYWDGNAENTPSRRLGEASTIDLLEHMTNDEVVRKARTGRGKYLNKISKNMIMKEGFENIENTISLSHLENRMLCCELLQENEDFYRFFMVYVQRLCELGLKKKLYVVCEGLLEGEVCGYDKRKLLGEVIESCARFRDVQRVLVYFGGLLERRGGEGGEEV